MTEKIVEFLLTFIGVAVLFLCVAAFYGFMIL